MTEKRFIIKNERTVCDDFYGKCFVCSWKSDAKEMCRLLNELHEEKQSVIEWIDRKIEEIKLYNSELCRATLLELKELLE